MQNEVVNDLRRLSPAAERNAAPILTELLRVLPPQGQALEIAAGTGQHAAHFAAVLPHWRWLPTDGDVRSLPSIQAWCQGLPNVQPALCLDVLATPWAGVPTSLDLVFCANLLHISTWATTAALMQGAARHLARDGLLVLYGPYREAGGMTAPSNLAFDADLRARDPGWGLRELDDVLGEARLAGLQLRERVALPANNLLLVLVRTPEHGATTPALSRPSA